MTKSETPNTEKLKPSQAALSDLLDEISKTQFINDNVATRIDHEFKAALATVCGGMSPLEIGSAYLNWLSHLAISPGKQLQLAQSFLQKGVQLGVYSIKSLLDPDTAGPATRLERRVSSDNWQIWPFNVLAQGHQVSKDYWQEATSDVAGVTPSHLALVNFLTGQILDALSPANFLATNADVINATIEQKGANLARGLRHFAQDTVNRVLKRNPVADQQFKVGSDLGASPGKVVYQNSLMELIQYSPVTEKVGAEPVLFCPAWIMKFYILDLSPRNSMVKYMVEQGKTVFMISWKNPVIEDRDVGFEDYLNLGLFSALDAIAAIRPNKKVNAVGYCIGGTLLCVGAAAMAREGDDRLRSISLFAAQADFSEAGEITRFISASQLEFLDNLMWKKGLLTSGNMGGAFGALRASDLIYGGSVSRYLMGDEPGSNDLMAWNADGTRMPYRMHSEYLHALFEHNQLARNKFIVAGKPVSMSDIKVPMFVLGTETDHVAPWKSVYKLHDLTRCDLTFLLTSGGHNAGVISGAVHPRRRYRMSQRTSEDNYVDPDTWMAINEVNPGSWWPAWDTWLDQKMSGQVKPPAMGATKKGYKPLRDAPGQYVMG